MHLTTFLLCLCAWPQVLFAASTYSPARPPAIPLAVRSPYLNTWLENYSGEGMLLVGQWTTFWDGHITAWTGLIRVDGQDYVWMGNPLPLPTSVVQTAFTYTSTRSTFFMTVGTTVSMEITFLSPVTPNDMKRQSLPFSYLEVKVTSLDGATHDVQIYTDITAEWLSSDSNALVQWQYGVESVPGTPGVAYHQIFQQTQYEFDEYAQIANWGNWYYATDNVANMTFQSGGADATRQQFLNQGMMLNSNDTNYRAINDGYPVFAYAVDLGSVGTTTATTLFTIGLCQQNAVQFAGAQGIEAVPSLWTTYFSTDTSAIAFFHQDYYTNAADLTTSIDTQIANDAYAGGGADYVTITTLAFRQAFGATQLAGSQDQPYLFLKEISSDGNAQTVDVIYPFQWVLLYINPSMLKMLLEPLLINQASGQYPNKYSMHDLGSLYPNATGHPAGNDEQQPLEECGNMLIMMLAYAQKTGDNAFLSQYYALLDQWTQYLVDEALYPENQISTDDFAGPLANQTNLALKGIIGIQAMSEVAMLTGNLAASTKYHDIAQDYITKWMDLAIYKNGTTSHTTLSYGDDSSHGLLYNIIADRLLNLNLVPQSVYDMQSDFYPSINEPYGVPLDTRHDWIKNDWQLYAAAVAKHDTQVIMINDIARFINETPEIQPMSDLYIGQTGGYQGFGFQDRPTVGAFFSILALPQCCLA